MSSWEVAAYCAPEPRDALRGERWNFQQVVRIIPIYKPFFLGHLAGVPQPDP